MIFLLALTSHQLLFVFPFGFGAAIVIGLIIYLVFNFTKITVRLGLNKKQRVKISDFREGEVAKISGNVTIAGKTLRAPLSGMDCVFYQVLVEQSRTMNNSSRWETIHDETQTGDVVITDGSGYACIETDFLQGFLEQDLQFNSGLTKDLNETVVEYLKKNEMDPIGFLGINKRLRVSEGILVEGDIFTAVGKGTWKHKSESGLDFPAEKILLISADNDIPVYFSDSVSELKRK